MSKISRKAIALITVFTITFTGLFVLDGTLSPVYGEVGSVAGNEDVSYDKDGNILDTLGIDTSQMPDDYDPDSTSNPYGSDVTSLNTVNEFAAIDMLYSESVLRGHDQPLDGNYMTFRDNKLTKQGVDFLPEGSFATAAACDLYGSGRDQGIALVYTNYNGANYDAANPDINNIYLRLYDPVHGTSSDPIVISNFVADDLKKDYIIQSQLQISCGDYDNDAVDEIAVYVPSPDGVERPKVAIYDLAGGKDCSDPYNISAWRHAWNYVLPKLTGASATVGCLHTVEIDEEASYQYITYLDNVYNNVNLVSGDADHDGSCDLVISYGASSTLMECDWLDSYSSIVRSTESKSVLLFGSDTGEMLREEQSLSYAGNKLIRVSFAFGDIDDDGQKELFMAGQLKSEQTKNSSRVLGIYAHDSDTGKMVPESVQNMDIIDGDYDDDGEFVPSNGWDDHYLSNPIMNTNLAVGRFYGTQSSTRIYLDSVLYSYDGAFQIEDELEDASVETDKDGDHPKGSQVLTDIKGMKADDWQTDLGYFEYGAQAGNYTGSAFDYLNINRAGIINFHQAARYQESGYSTLYVTGDHTNDLTLNSNSNLWDRGGDRVNHGSQYIIASPDTDIDGTVAEYTGRHEIKYSDPKVVAVLASAPYFKDVAAFDEGDMLNWCSTCFGESSGRENEYEHTLTVKIGAVGGFENSFFFTDDSAGNATTSVYDAYSDSKTFTLTYDTAGGEDAVVLFSVPSENFEYDVKGVTVDDDGNLTEYKETIYIANPHQPVTKTLTLDDYMEIQSHYDQVLPDVSKYLGSTPGDPSSYPSSENDIPEEAKSKVEEKNLGGFENKETGVNRQWAGVAYGTGRVTQSISIDHSEIDKDKSVIGGQWMDFNFGAQGGVPEVWTIKAGMHIDRDEEESDKYFDTSGIEFEGTVANMPRAAKDYGYDFSWRLFEYTIQESDDYKFPVVTYMVKDVQSPPELPDNIMQDFDKTTDSQIALNWTYTGGTPQAFDIYKYQDFPQGGGDKLVGTVEGSNYTIKKDENGNTMTDSNGHVIREYSFTESDLSADTKYKYRMKVRRTKFPQESIFSPVVEARTKVSQMPDVSLTSDNLTIYADGVYRLGAVVADADSYEGNINYQWQKYDYTKRIWDDVSGCNTRAIAFSKCKEEDAGTYRCRVNLVRKVESNPQYISAYTESCNVKFSLRSVVFGDIEVFEGQGSSPVNTGISVTVTNSSSTSVEKPGGSVQFRIVGPDATIIANVPVDEKTGVAKIDSIEDYMRSSSAIEAFSDGGYLVTALYSGTKVFYPAQSPEEYHYLRNIDECVWLSARSSYIFGEDIMQSAGLYDYKKNEAGKITRTDITDTIKSVKFYAADANGAKTGDAVAEYVLEDTDGKAPVPLHSTLSGNAYVEVYADDANDPVGHVAFDTEKRIAKMTLKGKLTGTDQLLELYDYNDIAFSGDGNLTEENIIQDDGSLKSLKDLLKFNYYEASGEFMFDSDNTDPAQFIPARYTGRIVLPDQIKTFYRMKYVDGTLTVVGNYYMVTAESKNTNEGVVSMVSPDRQGVYQQTGYAGGTKLVFKAIPNKGFKIKGWIVDECGTNQFNLPATETITYTVKSQNTSGTGNITIKAIFEPKNNTLIYGSKGSGSVSVSPDVSSGSVVVADTDLTFTAVPDEGWKFKEWRWVNDGGSNVISTGVPNEDGSNTKTFKMTDNSAEVYGVFMRDTIDIELEGNITASYINNGADPLETVGAEIATDNGAGVPKGTQVILKTKPGYSLGEDAEWNIEITTPEGTNPPEKTEESISDGCDCIKFVLPDDATACKAGVETEKGLYTVEASADDVEFTVKINGELREGGGLTGIEAGSTVEITAVPDRGKVLDGWVVNGQAKESNDNVYVATVTGNLSVSANTAPDEAVELRLRTEGGGTARYLITDKSGRGYTDTFGADEVTPEIYKGESLTLSATEDEDTYTLTAVSVNGSNNSPEDGSFTIEEVNEDAEIICRFTSSTFCTLTFSKDPADMSAQIFDTDELEIADGGSMSVPKGGTAEFNVIKDKGTGCYVYRDGRLETASSVTEYNESKDIVNYKIEGITGNSQITVRDKAAFTITNEGELGTFLTNAKNAGTASPDAVLANDIVITHPNMIDSCNAVYNGTFDGAGHTISGLAFGSEDEPDDEFFGFFKEIGPNGCVKDVVFENYVVYTSADDSNSKALLTSVNSGTISGVLMKDCELHAPDATGRFLAGIAADNEGTITGCKVQKLKLFAADLMADQGGPGSAGVLVNGKESASSAVMKNNFFDGCTYSDGTGSREATKVVVADPDSASYGSFESNYYKVAYASPSASDPNGISAYSLTADPDDETSAVAEAATPEFACKLAYTMNAAAGENIWSLSSSNDTDIVQKKFGDGSKAPVKADFKYSGNTYTQYLYPDNHKLPDADELGADAPPAWEYKNKAYSAGCIMNISEDSEFIGVTDISDYTACVWYEGGSKTFFKDIDEALVMVQVHNGGDVQHLDIMGTCEIGGKQLTIDNKTTVELLEGSALTINSDEQITNNGTFVVNEGSTLKKYGTIYNNGTITVGGTFINYGSKLTNKGTINNREGITCKPHCLGKWVTADEPNEDGSWDKSCTCSVCGYTDTDTIPADPSPDTVSEISIMTEPAKVDYLTGEAFSDEGLKVMAVLSSGDKAMVKTFTLAEGETEITSGAVLGKGSHEISVCYGDFKCSFTIKVSDAPPEPASIKDAAVVLSKTTFTFSGKAQKPAVKTIGGKTLKAGTDYTIKWSNANSMGVGTYTLTITGQGGYKDSTKATYTINPKGAKIRKIGKGKRSLTVKWKKLTVAGSSSSGKSSSSDKGYQIQVARNKKFTKNRKTVTVKGGKKKARKITGLKGGKKYYVRIRSYSIVNGKKYYSDWSKAKTAKTKK